ncbi:hypothetical protein O1R50_01295 [Glycomyces luteolus]|uniref:Uncharacterized protein n=1 Tax=Glycomyces luteolus TaxID=2670330 RepID=A0A9X3T213_9ACTN|nr:hypothetical protein [Glycomyces luteolus]MDA1358240.1 hypothetical protein [Glycomyces luteolus]
MATAPEPPAPPTDAELYGTEVRFPAAATIALALANPQLRSFRTVLMLHTGAVGLSMLDGIRTLPL